MQGSSSSPIPIPLKLYRTVSFCAVKTNRYCLAESYNFFYPTHPLGLRIAVLPVVVSQAIPPARSIFPSARSSPAMDRVAWCFSCPEDWAMGLRGKALQYIPGPVSISIPLTRPATNKILSLKIKSLDRPPEIAPQESLHKPNERVILASAAHFRRLILADLAN